MLGVMTSLTIEVVPAYRLAERIEHWPLDEVLARWDELFAGHRHFSFFWLPSEASAELYGLATPPGRQMTDTCYVKVYDEAGADVADDATPGRPRRPQLPHLPGRVRAELPRARVLRARSSAAARRSRRCAS